MRAVISTSANSSDILVISILEDLWHDYLSFKKEAANASKNDKSLLSKRYLRASLLILMSYFEGVVNDWCTKLLAKQKTEKNIQNFIRNKSLVKKINFLISEVSRKASSVNNPEFIIAQEAKKLRNEIVHLKPGSDMVIYESLSLELLNQTEEELIKWLEQVGGILGLESHPNTRRIAEVLGSPFDETVWQEDSGDF